MNYPITKMSAKAFWAWYVYARARYNNFPDWSKGENYLVYPIWERVRNDYIESSEFQYDYDTYMYELYNIYK
jgi:hypothetical protein